ncbi:MAG: hypothetical protein ABWX84_09015 [Nocardioides sp.]
MHGLHLLASLVCVVAAVVMLRADAAGRNRVAHLVVLTTMVVLAVVSHSVGVAFACALVLAATAAVVRRRAGERASRACAVDVAACSGLVLLMAASHLLMAGGHGADPATSDHGLHHDVHALIPGTADHALGLLVPAGVLITAWVLARRDATATRPGRGVTAATWAMMLGMAAMVALPSV